MLANQNKDTPILLQYKQEEGEPPKEDTIVLKSFGIDNLVNKEKPSNEPT